MQIMQIVCPHCATAYDVPGEALPPAGRKVRCARCKETWLALPTAEAALAGGPAADDPPFPAGPAPEPVHIDSPPLAAEMPEEPAPTIDIVPTVTRAVPEGTAEPVSAPLRSRRPAVKRVRSRLPYAVAALAALCAGLLVWRADVVRLMPQTAAFFRAIGLAVNLRQLDFADLRTTAETVSGKPVLVIEGEIVARRRAEVPRLRFSLRDAAGAEVLAWNATIEQAVLDAGERAPFRSMLAAPPPQGREIAVRFFNRHDMAGGK